MGCDPNMGFYSFNKVTFVLQQDPIMGCDPNMGFYSFNTVTFVL